MENLESFLKASTEHFSHYQSEASGKYQWRSLMFASDRVELEKVALNALYDGVKECKIGKKAFKRSNIFVLTTFHENLAEALAFRSKWYENPMTTIAGPIPLGVIERQFLNKELSSRAAEQVMREIFGTEDAPLLVNLEASKS